MSRLTRSHAGHPSHSLVPKRWPSRGSLSVHLDQRDHTKLLRHRMRAPCRIAREDIASRCSACHLLDGNGTVALEGPKV